MLDRLIRPLERRFPRLREWLGNRPEYTVSAYGASVVMHVLLVVLMLAAGFLMGREASKTIEAAIVDTALPELERLDATELVETDIQTTLEPVLARTAPRLSPRIVRDVVEPDQELEIDPLSMSPSLLLPASATLSNRVQLKGDGAEHVNGVEGAVDRLALEILRQLEKGRLLVVWAFDASRSLQVERDRLADHIEQVYAHVLERPEADEAEASEGGLLSMVVAFGQGRKAMLDEPTSDPSAISEAIRAVPLDKSGEETTFQTTIDVARRWGDFEVEDQPYRTMTIIITDEVGEDEEKLEAAVAAAKSAEMPVYVLGSSALFGRVEGYMDYTDPETGRYYRRLPMHQGPESAEVEVIRLPFWYSGPQYNELDSGFGPYGLSRLAGTTGGIYFVTRINANRPTFDPAGMREYRPDWVSRGQYQAAAARNPLRQAVLAASRITQQNLPGQPSLTFPTAGTPEFKKAMERNQEIVARVIYTVDEALVPIMEASSYRDRETSRRWQAHYDLIKARLLAMKIRCFEYNWACARMKVEPLSFTKEKSNAWRLTPDTEIHYSSGAARAAEEATALLERVVTEHRGTPWAMLAQRERKDPFGFRWVETYVPPPRNNNGGGGDRNRNERPKNNAPAPPVPKL